MNNQESPQGGAPQGDQTNAPPGGYTPAPAPPPSGPGAPPTQYAPPQGYMPQPGAPYPAAPAPPPERKKSPVLIILAIIGGVVLLCGVVGILSVGGLVGGVLAATQPVADAGDAYMRALRDGDYNKAFDLSAPALRQDAGNAAGIEAALGSKQPASWSFNSRNITNNDGSLSGTTKYKNGEDGTVEMSLTKIGNDWKVVGISLK